MKHARPDYQEAIIDLRATINGKPTNEHFRKPGAIPDDEPVFLLRAQDKHAAATLRFYAEQVAREGGDAMVVLRTIEHAYLMDGWPKKKAPDLPKPDLPGRDAE